LEVICLSVLQFHQKPKAEQTVKLTSHYRATASLLERRGVARDVDMQTFDPSK
jgi:hypothetical protein